MELTEAQLKQARKIQSRQGGLANVKKHGRKHMQDISKLGNLKRWSKIKKV